MDQLIFIGVLIAFSAIMDVVGRKKRKEMEGSEPLPPGDAPEARTRLPEPPLPTYDRDPSFEDAVRTGSRGATGPITATPRGPAGQGGPSAPEGLIPADVWEEIQALARGAKPPVRSPSPPAPAPSPQRAPARTPRATPVPMSTTARETRVPAAAETDAGVRPEHAAHLSHAQFGKPVHDRLTGFDEHARGRGPSADGKAVRDLLRGGGPGLRQAVVLQEILGPPVSLKDDPSAG